MLICTAPKATMQMPPIGIARLGARPSLEEERRALRDDATG